MIWLTWRQLRVQVAAAALGAVAVVVVAAMTGPRLAEIARRATSVYDTMTGSERTLHTAGIVLLAVAPAVIGAFWGAPLLARELEAGTHRLAWNQSITRTRWLATKLGMTVLFAAVAVGVISLAVTWWAQPVDGVTGNARGALPSRLTPISFAMRGLAPVGYTVFAVVLGTTLGAVLRRTLPAMAVTLALYIAVQIAVPLWVRPHLAPPVSATIAASRSTLDGMSTDPDGSNTTVSVHTADRGDWILTDETVDPAGHPTALPAWFGSCLPAPGPTPGGDAGSSVAHAVSPDVCLQRLTDAGYRQHVTYQPANRFWRLQATETALFVGLSALLGALCVWWVRRRIT